MQRFFVDFPLMIDCTLTESSIVSQITRVLRMKEGDHIILFDGSAREIEYEIMRIEKKSITLRGVAEHSPDTEPKKRITLYQALPNKYEKIEYIIQKGVEVGIRKFVFFRSDFSQKLVISPAKVARFSVIAREALEQCGWLRMPEIVFLDQMPQVREGESHIVLDTVGKVLKIPELGHIPDMGLWVGPEGGWSPQERDEMMHYGFIFARFGERVLRTETAWVVFSFAYIHS